LTGMNYGKKLILPARQHLKPISLGRKWFHSLLPSFIFEMFITTKTVSFLILNKMT
jgi:hypothetical protein